MLRQTFLAVLVILLAVSSGASAQSVPCRSTSTQDTVLVNALVAMAADERSKPIRTVLGVQQIDSNSVQIVRDSLVCTQVTRAIEMRLGHPARSLAYMVATVGSHYVAYEPNMTGGGQLTLFVLDSAFTFRRAIGLP